jgi:hypothetical protein
MIGIHHQINHSCFDHLESPYVVGRFMYTVLWNGQVVAHYVSMRSIPFIESVELDPFKKIQGFISAVL